VCCRRQGSSKCAASGAQRACRLPCPEPTVDRPAVAVWWVSQEKTSGGLGSQGFLSSTAETPVPLLPPHQAAGEKRASALHLCPLPSVLQLQAAVEWGRGEQAGLSRTDAAAPGGHHWELGLIPIYLHDMAPEESSFGGDSPSEVHSRARVSSQGCQGRKA
jgi:hypothetical protein